MRPIILPLLIGAVAAPLNAQAAPPAAPPAQPGVTLPAELDRVLRDYETAWRAGDHERLAQLFTEDGFILPNGRPPIRGRAAIAAHYKGQSGPLQLRALAHHGQRQVALGAAERAQDADGAFDSQDAVLAFDRGGTAAAGHGGLPGPGHRRFR